MMEHVAAMTVELQPGERLQVGEATLEFVHKRGRVARLRVLAPPRIAVRRQGALALAHKEPVQGLTGFVPIMRN